MTIRRTETRRYRLDKEHEGCKAEVPGVLLFSHRGMGSFPYDPAEPLMVHRCSACEETQCEHEQWPKVEYGDTSDTLTAAEALFGFVGWLTTRKEKTVMSVKDDCSPSLELLTVFCKTNHLSPVRDHWEKALKMPEEK